MEAIFDAIAIAATITLVVVHTGIRKMDPKKQLSFLAAEAVFVLVLMIEGGLGWITPWIAIVCLTVTLGAVVWQMWQNHLAEMNAERKPRP